MTFQSFSFPRITTALIVALVALAALTGAALHHERRQLLQARQDINLITRDRDEAQAQTKAAMIAITLNHDVSQATNGTKQRIKSESEKSAAYIERRLSDDTCANTTIDGLSVKRLRDYSNGLRNSASGAAAH